ncbi:MAG: hypothetical protein V3W34_02830, partial [Phycisphaerae bacterium]
MVGVRLISSCCALAFLSAAVPAATVTLDFETQDDFVTLLVNGQDISTPPEFGALVAISDAGAGHAGAAIFDSTPCAGGPNCGAGDPDLLVGLGNILILQNSALTTQTVPGIFDTPNDDPGGGTLVFDFLVPNVKMISVDLVDINGGGSSVIVLTDGGGKTRTYSVPDNWTKDISASGPDGFDTLDLTTLAPQLGEGGATATASEDAGFDATDAVKLTVAFGGSGAMDNLQFVYTGACCDRLNNVCTEDLTETACLALGSASFDEYRWGGPGSTCATIDPPCVGCDTVVPCPTCTEKVRPAGGSVEIELVSSSFDGTDTTFTYRICQVIGPAISHWVLGMSPECCLNFLSATGGSPGNPTACGTDPSTGLFGLKWETGIGVAACDGLTCGNPGSTFTVTFSGSVPDTSCLKSVNKLNGPPSSAFGCIKGPNCSVECVDDTDCAKCEFCGLATNTCEPLAPGACCVSDADCPSDTKCVDHFCDLITNTCDSTVTPSCCENDGDCPADTKCDDHFCDLITNACDVSTPAGCCELDADCPMKCDVCDVFTNTCVTVAGCCESDADCSPDPKCFDSFCDLATNSCQLSAKLPNCCTADAQCGKCELCDLATNTCFKGVPNC